MQSWRYPKTEKLGMEEILPDAVLTMKITPGKEKDSEGSRDVVQRGAGHRQVVRQQTHRGSLQ